MRDMMAALGRFGLFLFRILGAIRPSRAQWRDTVRQIYVIGARSVPIIAVGGAFVGLVMTLQGYRALVTFGAGNALGTMLSLTVFRELGPVLTAILFCGAGSAMAAELADARHRPDHFAVDDGDRSGRQGRGAAFTPPHQLPLLTAVFIAFSPRRLEAEFCWVDGSYFWPRCNPAWTCGKTTGRPS